MKHFFASHSFLAAKATLLALCVALLTNTPASAGTLLSSGINLGHAGPDLHNWAIFSLGGESSPNELLNSSVVSGDVALAGSGKLNMSGAARVNGKVYKRTSGTVNLLNSATITGGVVSNSATDAFLAQGVIDANNASNAAFALSSSAGFPTTINANNSLTLSGSGTAVLKLTDFVLSGDATLTLHGSASTAFVINVSRNFSLSNSGNVKLSGGLTWENVLFNIRGTGSTVTLGGASKLNGILLATNRTVSVENSGAVNGEIIANKVKLSGAATVTRPALVSP